MFAAKNELLTRPSTGGYQISRSLRFNSADSAYLNRTPASATNQKTWTFSAWVKRASISATEIIVFGKADTYISINSNSLTANFANGGPNYFMQATAVLRDPSAWYHIIIVLDTTQATAANRASMYVNGVQTTAFQSSTYTNMAQNYDAAVNSAAAHAIGRYSGASPSNYFDGYMTEVNFIDGQALTPSSFGETSAQTGVWQPKAFAGTYGTNGFYLNFSDNSNTTAATLGKDYSGNGNNWTPNNFSVTAGVDNDSMVDSPTSYGTDTGAGGTVRGNYATLNPLDYSLQATTTFSNGNLDVSIPYNVGYTNAQSTFSVSSGKWYCEVTPTNINGAMIGICDASVNTYDKKNFTSASWWGYFLNGNKYNNNTGSAYGASFTTNDVIGIALDMDTGAVTFYKNGTSQGVAFNTNISGKTIQISLNNGSGSATQTYTVNFGQRPFAYTAPSGFKALVTQNLPAPTIGSSPTTLAGKYFNPVLYTGTGSSQSITGVGFQPDLVWAKIRSGAKDNNLTDAVRGTSKALFSNTTGAEVSGSWVTAFNSDGFTVGTEADANQSGQTFVAWNWRASNTTAVTNTSGSITSTVSANTTSGFSVVTYTGTGANATVGHGLGVAPAMVIYKNRTSNSSWIVYHTSISPTNLLVLNDGTAQQSGTAMFNSTSATSSVLSIGSNSDINGSAANYVAYCFAPVAGYSAFGSYTGNGSTDGPFVFTGMRPAYLMIRRTAAENWYVYDVARGTYNVIGPYLQAQSSGVESSGSIVDFLSNGFKIRETGSGTNTSASTYIYMAFASNPFKYSLAR